MTAGGFVCGLWLIASRVAVALIALPALSSGERCRPKHTAAPWHTAGTRSPYYGTGGLVLYCLQQLADCQEIWLFFGGGLSVRAQPGRSRPSKQGSPAWVHTGATSAPRHVDCCHTPGITASNARSAFFQISHGCCCTAGWLRNNVAILLCHQHLAWLASLQLLEVLSTCHNHIHLASAPALAEPSC